MDSGWWCAVVRRAGISLIRELEPLERLMLSPESASLGLLGNVFDFSASVPPYN